MQDIMKRMFFVYLFTFILIYLTCAFLAYKKQWRNIKKNDVVFYIFDQLQVVYSSLYSLNFPVK